MRIAAVLALLVLAPAASADELVDFYLAECTAYEKAMRTAIETLDLCIDELDRWDATLRSQVKSGDFLSDVTPHCTEMNEMQNTSIVPAIGRWTPVAESYLRQLKDAIDAAANTGVINHHLDSVSSCVDAVNGLQTIFLTKREQAIEQNERMKQSIAQTLEKAMGDAVGRQDSQRRPPAK